MRNLAIFCLVISSYSAASSASAPQSGDDVYFCGGETTGTVVASYFEKLKTTLAEPGPSNRFNQLVADKFGITDANGKTLWFDLKDFNSITPGRITMEEWQHISDRGPAELENAGWRGCFMDHGKVWFEADGKSGFRLRSINKSMERDEG